ncbi:PAS domain-containing protein [Rufibacter glacialis]|nr:PAS domain-containing protein [Rufibacter glacialis]
MWRTDLECSLNLLENSADGMVAFDTQFQVTAWNTAMGRIMSKTKETMLGKSVLSLFPEEKRRYLQHHLARVLQGHGITTYGLPGLPADRSYEIHLEPVSTAASEVVGGLFILHDITRRRMRQKAYAWPMPDEQKELAPELYPEQEEKHSLVSKALPHSLGHLLHAAKRHLADLMLKDQTRPPSKASPLHRINGLLEDAIKETDLLAHDLMPTTLQNQGLKTALLDLAQRWSTEHFCVQSVVIGFGPVQDTPLETSLFIIVQELLGNTRQQPWVTEVLVQVIDKGPQVMVRVEYNGSDAALGLRTSGNEVGLFTLQDRIQLLQGTMHVSSTSEEGTVVTVLLPKKTEEKSPPQERAIS